MPEVVKTVTVIEKPGYSKKTTVVSNKKEISKKPMDKKEISKKPMDKKEISKKPMDKKEISKKPMDKKEISKKLKKAAKTVLGLTALIGGAIVVNEVLDLNNLSAEKLVKKYEKNYNEYQYSIIQVDRMLKKIGEKFSDELDETNRRIDTIERIFDNYKDCKEAGRVRQELLSLINIILSNFRIISSKIKETEEIYKSFNLQRIDLTTEETLNNKRKITNFIQDLKNKTKTLRNLLNFESIIIKALMDVKTDIERVRKALDSKNLNELCQEEKFILKSARLEY